MFDLVFLAGIFLFSLVVGYFLEKIKIPWLFAALLFGVIMNALGIKPDLSMLGTLGMYFMLFLVGFELDLEKMKELSDVVINTTLAIQVLSTAAWTLILMAFGYPWWIALIIGLTAHCVGEAVLVPILDELNLLKSRIGQVVLGVGTLDDVFEVAALLLAGSIAGAHGVSVGNLEENLSTSIFILLILVSIVFIMIKVEALKSRLRKTPKIDELMLIGITTLFTFIALGDIGHVEGVGAILAGIGMRNLVPNKELERAETGMKSLVYSFLAPIFFTWVGLNLDLGSILVYPLLTLGFYIIPAIGKVAASWIVLEKRFGKLHALFAGIALSIRFSTELVVAQLLFSYHLIDSVLFTAIVASSALATVVNPFILIGVTRWIGVKEIASKRVT